MVHRLGQRHLSVLCLATNRVVDFVYAAHHRRITDWNLAVLNPPALQTYADCIHQHGAPLNNCFGFIDGTVRPIARPGTNQLILYNGHKIVHSLKFQAVAIPNGLIAHLHGPVGKNLIYSFIEIKKKHTHQIKWLGISYTEMWPMGCLISFIIETCQKIYSISEMC